MRPIKKIILLVIFSFIISTVVYANWGATKWGSEQFGIGRYGLTGELPETYWFESNTTYWDTVNTALWDTTLDTEVP